MPLGQLLRAFAFEVAPGQDKDFLGGQVGVLTDLAVSLEEAARKGKLDEGLMVNLVVSGPERVSPVRAAVVAVAHESDAAALAATSALAERLAAAMDHRSDPCMLLLSVHELNGNKRQVVAWTFPQERVIRRSAAGVDLLDAFSLSSRLRKAASLSGANGKGDFLTARVLDAQTTASDKTVADFWVSKFLDAKLQVDSLEGTTLMANALRRANDLLAGKPLEQQKLHSAIDALRSNPRDRWSIRTVANELIPAGDAREALLRAGGNREDAAAIFTVDIERLDKLIQYHHYTLDNGVTVSAPFKQLGDGVVVEEVDGRRHLNAQGFVEAEKIRSGR